ncbi:MAG: hypothetical protein LBD63_02845, partial [Mycoplasmataceae bacterium]|nr:hypothetical protein [Mycoplasmataceae bacterium]
MRLRKILFSLLTLTAVGSVATTLITSCSGVSKDILNNMVSLGDDSKFADSIGNNSFDLQHEINIALTDKTATDAFKTSVVNKILKGWFDSLTGIATIDNDKKQWKKDISDDWDNKIQAAKNAHLSNWKYYFQNETLNPVGGTKAKWEQSQWYSKIRDYFVTEITKNNYLAIPQRDASLNKNFYVEDNNGNYLVDFNHPVDYNISGSKITDLLGSGTISSASSADVLNPDWWPTINFYATANKSYTSSSQDQDKSYALIQQMAFEEYTKNVRPLSTGYVLWNYSLPAGKTDLKDIYNNAEINDGGSTAKKSSTDKDKAGDDPAPTPGLLSTPSYAFPYFGEVSPTPTSATGPEDQFRAFAAAFNAGNQFLDNRGVDGQGSSALGLVDIPIDMDYSAKNDTTLALINQSSNTGTDDTPYETYIAPILDMYYLYETKTTESSYYTNTMPVYYSTSSGTDKSFFPDTTHILKNFLFKNQTDENQPGSSVKTVPTNLDRTDRGGTLDLKNIYRDDSDS